MADIPSGIPGLEQLQRRTTGDPRVVVAVIDGPVDAAHPSMQSATLTTVVGEPVPECAPDDPAAAHGTHVASVIFGNGHDGVRGVAPECSGVVIPLFEHDRRRVPQIDIARAIEAAIEGGAHIVNFSGGEHSDSGDADDWLANAVQLAEDRGVLLIAAAGNDGCDCLHVPAALPTVLAVGALDDAGDPLEFSNWGPAYAANGLTAPGSEILGAVPGGRSARASGTSAAAPIVSGVAALMVSLQIQDGQQPNPLEVRRALLDGAQPCRPANDNHCRRLLGGTLDIEGALRTMTTDQTRHDNEPEIDMTSTTPSNESTSDATSLGNATGAEPADACDCGGQDTSRTPVGAAALTWAPGQVDADAPVPVAAGPVRTGATPSVVDPEPSLVYALGTLGYDFGTEARRDAFKQLMAPQVNSGVGVPANPHDSRQMVAHLNEYPSEAQSLIWTLNLELTPLYAVEAVGPYAAAVYESLRDLLEGEVQAPTSEEFVERVSIPGRMSGRNVRLFSGQVVPVVEIDSTRGLYGWRTQWLLDTATEQLKALRDEDVDEQTLREAVMGFLNRVYFDMRNLGTLSRDRALNFAATNVFQAATAFAEALTVGMQLDTIDVVPSPYARVDADAWDVKLKFFDPENLKRARRVFRFTVDVSEVMPVTMGEVRSWSASQ